MTGECQMLHSFQQDDRVKQNTGKNTSQTISLQLFKMI